MEFIFKSKRKRNKHTASLDRIDSTKAYTKKNVPWVHKDINKMKHNLKLVTFLQYCKNITKHNNGKV